MTETIRHLRLVLIFAKASYVPTRETRKWKSPLDRGYVETSQISHGVAVRCLARRKMLGIGEAIFECRRRDSNCRWNNSAIAWDSSGEATALPACSPRQIPEGMPL